VAGGFAAGGWRRLRIVNRAAVALFPSGVLHFFELLFLVLELDLNALYLLLLFFLVLVPRYAIGDAISWGEADRLAESGNLAFERRDLTFLFLNL
jgi:hypothetical protein